MNEDLIDHRLSVSCLFGLSMTDIDCVVYMIIIESWGHVTSWNLPPSSFQPNKKRRDPRDGNVTFKL